MIQRIQSIFLLLAAASMASLYKFPFAQSNSSESPFFEDQAFTISDHSILIALTILGVLTSFVSIFLYKNRQAQLRTVNISLILSLFLAVVAIWLVYSSASSWSDEMSIDDGLGIYMTLASLICIVLANIFIKKDENTVRSMDRLR